MITSTEVRECKKCGVPKALSEFDSAGAGYAKLSCKACNRHINVAAQRKYAYGITDTQYRALLEQQHGVCAVCGEGEVKLGRGGSVRSLSVDHCHTSGKIRGLVCDRCNRVLGFSKDDPALLRRLAAYIESADTGLNTGGLSKQEIASLIDKLQSSLSKEAENAGGNN